MEVNLSNQEKKVISYLLAKNNSRVAWEELAQFAKEPQSVKLKTIKKTISEIKRKFSGRGESVPFKIDFYSLSEKPMEQLEINGLAPAFTDPSPILPMSKTQTLVQVQRKSNSLFPKAAPSVSTTSTPVSAPALPKVHAEFQLDFTMKRVRTKFGYHKLNDSEWDVFKYVHANHGKLIPISELRDKVVFYQYGSKMPARWFDAIMRIINNLRRAVPGLAQHLLTVKGSETSYLFQ